jgi:hypothetical protein
VRTTIDLDPVVLQQLKDRGKREGKTIGQLASELLARVLANDNASAEEPDLNWVTQHMGAMIDLEDKEALYRVLDQGRHE